MIVSAEEMAELEAFFNSITLPQVMKLNAAITLHDVASFVGRTIKNLKKPEIMVTAIRPRYEDLLRIREILTRLN